MRISDWSSDVCSSDLRTDRRDAGAGSARRRTLRAARHGARADRRALCGGDPMTGRFDLLIRNARDARGRGTSIGIREGRIAAIGPDGGGKGPEYDARGRTVGAGLHDHHLHLLATAERMEQDDLSACRPADAAIARPPATAGPGP